MANKKRVIPKKFVYIDKDFKTRATRNPRTGKLTGRETVQGYGDKTAVLRVKKGHSRAGEIMGRTSPIPVRGDSQKRGTIRKRL